MRFRTPELFSLKAEEQMVLKNKKTVIIIERHPKFYEIYDEEA